MTQMHPFINPSLPYSEDEQKLLGGFKAGGGPAEDIPLVVAVPRLRAKLLETVTFEHEVLEDNHAAPRDFWHVRAVMGGDEGIKTGWMKYGELGDHKKRLPDDVIRRVESQAFSDLFYAVLQGLGLEDFY